MPPTIRGYCSSNDASPSLQALCNTLGIEQTDTLQGDSWVLKLQNTVLSLKRPDGVEQHVDFTQGKARHRTTEAGLGAGPLRKALGISRFIKRHNRSPHVVDTTGGWGQDAWAIASLGCETTVIEQHPVVHALLQNGLQRALDDPDGYPIASRITLAHAQAEDFLTNGKGDILYLDPMYPERKRKKADSKKGMQFLHALLGPTDETRSEKLLSAALNHPAQRVVVKRPKGAAALPAEPRWRGQQLAIASPNTRYDVYLRNTE